MRIANKMLFDTSTYRLGKLNLEMYKANETIATGKRLQTIGDDPVSLSHVMHLKSSIDSMAQLDKNLDVGKNWLDATDSCLESLKDLINQLNKEVSQLITASSGPQQRKDAVARVDSILRQVVDLGNTRVNGSYIFAGSRTDSPPFQYHDKESPPYVSYSGDHEAFRIRTGPEKSVEVGRDGSALFNTRHVEVNSTNNTLVFQEDKGLGPAFLKTMTLTLPTGEYKGKELAREVENRMNALSLEEGYGLDYSVGFDEEKRIFSIRENSLKEGGSIRSEILWSTGGEPRIENAGVKGDIAAESLHILVKNPDAIGLATKPDEPFTLVWDGKDSFSIKNNPGYVLPSKIKAEDGKILLDLTDNGSVDLEISFDMENIKSGDSIYFSMQPFTGNISIGREMGFYDDNTTLLPLAGAKIPPYITAIEIDGTNQDIDFAEVDVLGNRTVAKASLNLGIYNDIDALTAEIKAAMEAASPNGSSYAVSYDEKTSRFSIREEGGKLLSLELLWRSGSSAGASSVGRSLGFDIEDDLVTYPFSNFSPELFKLSSANNRINFEEELGGLNSGPLTAIVPAASYNSIADFEAALSQALSDASANGVTYSVTYDYITRKFSISDDGSMDSVKFLWASGSDRDKSIAGLLGFDDSSDTIIPAANFPYEADSGAFLFSIDADNKYFDFQEVDESGRLLDLISIALPEKKYSDPHDLALDLQIEMNKASSFNSIYRVSYDETNNLFSIRGSGEGVKEIRFLWKSGPKADRSIAETLGFDKSQDISINFPESDESVVRIVVDSSNNKFDFRELSREADKDDFCQLTAEIPHGTYTSMDELAKALEKSMELVSRNKGVGVDYQVAYDEDNQRFFIKEESDKLLSLDLLFASGDNRALEKGGTGLSAASLFGFNERDYSYKVMESNRNVEWGLFRTLNDLMYDLDNNDVEGLEQGLLRLETSFKHLNSLHADTGIRYNRLDIQQIIHIDMKLSLSDRKSQLEDADYIEAFMQLQSRELAYQAAMNSTAKIMKMSIMDYM